MPRTQWCRLLFLLNIMFCLYVVSVQEKHAWPAHVVIWHWERGAYFDSNENQQPKMHTLVPNARTHKETFWRWSSEGNFCHNVVFASDTFCSRSAILSFIIIVSFLAVASSFSRSATRCSDSCPCYRYNVYLRFNVTENSTLGESK